MNESTSNPEHIKSILLQSQNTIDELLEWKDEIPSEILNGESEIKNYKVRGNWFQGIVALTGFLKLLEIFTEKELKDISLFEQHYQACNFPKLTSREDIENGNQILSLMKNAIERYTSDNSLSQSLSSKL